MGLMEAVADDVEAELMQKVCETEVGVTPGMLKPLTVTKVTNP